ATPFVISWKLLKTVKRYYAFKKKHHIFYDNLVPSNEKNIFEHDILTVLPARDQHFRRILVIELGKPLYQLHNKDVIQEPCSVASFYVPCTLLLGKFNQPFKRLSTALFSEKWKHTKCTLDEVFKGCVLYLEAAMLENMTQVAGAVVIFDMDGLSMQQTWQFTPPFAKRIVDWLQDAMPCRIKNIHIINQPYIFNVVFALFKPFLREKLRKRIIFHGTDRKSLHSYLTPKCLPKSYGGTLEIPRITGVQWLELLNLCDEEFQAINSYGYDRS
ncbi:hypothetical protein Trydic_g14747, partial [Trypoxylus dichotomus]